MFTDDTDIPVSVSADCDYTDNPILDNTLYAITDVACNNIAEVLDNSSEVLDNSSEVIDKSSVDIHVSAQSCNISGDMSNIIVEPRLDGDLISSDTIGTPCDRSSSRCLLCDSTSHETAVCTECSVSRMRRKIKQYKLCFLCLSENYKQPHLCNPINKCEKVSCKIKSPHVKLICQSKSDLLNCVLFASELKYQISGINRLSTLLVWVEDPVSKLLYVLRCMLDTGASHTYIRSRIARLLNLKLIEKRRAQISSFGKTEIKDCDIVQATVHGCRDSSRESMEMTLIAVDKLCSPEPSYNLSVNQWKVIKDRDIKLADLEATNNGLLPIDIIIGQDFYHTLVDGPSLALPEGLRLVPTIFSTYMLAGSSTVVSSKVLQGSNFTLSTAMSSEEEQVTIDDFASLDVLGISPEEDIDPVLDHFYKKTRKVGDRFEVELPKIYPKVTKLATNLSQSFARLVGGHRKRQRKSDQSEFIKYNESIEDYVKRGYLEKVAPLGTVQEVREQLAKNPYAFDRVAAKSNSTIIHYMPHHAVFKASTGKLRVVYDGKAKPYKGAYSLNDCLEKGPNLMNSLLHILLRFRKGKFAAKADVEKAYLQVQICEEDRDLLRILWIDKDQVWIYRFTRLPFGIRPAPFLLAAVMLKQLSASDMDDDLRDRILASFYVDDAVFSERTLSGLLDRKTQSVDSFKDAGMLLRDWTSNDPEARTLFSKEEDRELPEQESVLGLLWDLPSDTIGVNDQRILGLIGKRPKTKRTLWSFINKLHDPLGLVSPYTKTAKHLTREASITCKGWDNKLTDDLADRVTKWMQDFVFLKDIRLPRYIGLDNPVWQRLVGFCDASGTGIAACVYLVSYDGEKTISHLVKANTHIPTESMKTRIPRLELIGAVMLANLMNFVCKSYPEILPENIHYFTDSADVLYWIYSGASHWDVFVANRISTIRQLTEVQSWKHVTSARNPADIPSRGCSLAKLRYLTLYWNGPDFIKGSMVDEESTVKGYDVAYTKEVPPGCRAELKTRLNFVSEVPDYKPAADISKILDISRYGTYHKLISLTKVILKFLNKLDESRCSRLSKPSLLKIVGYDSTESAAIYKGAELLWVQATQKAHFPEMFKLIKNTKARVAPSVKSVFQEHKIFLESQNKVLCCQTRMENSNLPISTIYPMLLPSNSIFTDLLIRHMHVAAGHQGTPQTLSHIRSEYWVLQGRRSVQKVLRRCVQCRKVDGKCFQLPPHPPLPDFRVQRNRPYSFIGLDYMGPFTIKEPNTEDLVSKVYVLMITCASSRSVHLEATRSLALNDFLMALDRFFNYRGIPSHVESDCAPTFLRCDKELKSLFKSDRVIRFFEKKRINWNFYTEKSPHKGGFIERLNDIFKRACRKNFGNAQLDFEEFRTMVCYAMGTLNDRPITYVYSNSDDGMILTPSLLTLGYNLREPPHIRFTYKMDEITRKYGQQFADLEKRKNEFWNYCSEVYNTELFERHIKGSKLNPNRVIPKIGNICLLKRENTPRRKWPLCRIIEFKEPKYDEHVRECVVQTVSPKAAERSESIWDPIKPTILRRPVDFLIPLEIEPHLVEGDPLVKTYTYYKHNRDSSGRKIGSSVNSEISLNETETNLINLIETLPTIKEPNVNSKLKFKVNKIKKAVKNIKPKKTAIESDKSWEPNKLLLPNTETSDRVLRPRSKSLGLVINN